MRALILASLLGLCAVAHAGPPWTFMMDPDRGRIATVEQTSSGYPGTSRLIVRIPKGQKGFDGKEITTANLKVYRGGQLTFGARLKVLEGRNDVRMIFEVPDADLPKTELELQSSPISPVTFLLRLSDHLDADGRLPNRQTDQAEQGVAPQSATRSESDSEGVDKPQPESKPRPR